MLDRLPTDIAFYRALPKAELHCHLDGSVRPGTLIELAKEQNISLPASDASGILAAIRAGQIRQSLEDYLIGFELTLAVMQTQNALARIGEELVLDAAAEGVWHLEVRFSPLLHRGRGLDPDAVVDAVLAGIGRGRTTTGMSVGLILCGIRNLDPQTSIEIAELAVAKKSEGVVGFDLAGPERGYPARTHQRAFDLAHQGGIGITVHAGEAEDAWAVGQAMREQHATRVGHGTKLIADAALIEAARAHGLALEICLQSNLETQSVARLSEHPFGEFLRRGLKVTLNTDNRLMSKTGLSEEYQRAVIAFGLTTHELARVVRNGFEAAFLPTEVREALRARTEQRLEQFGFAGAIPF